LALTDAGCALLDRVGPALGEIDAAVADARDSDAAPAGPVRITLTPLSAHALFAPHLAAFVAAYPGITLDLVIDDRFVDTVAEGYDLGVRLGETLRPDMIATRIGGALRMAAVASPGYLARHGRPRTLEDLPSHRCLHRRLGAGVYRWEVTRDGADLILDALPQTLIVNDDALLRRAVCDGAGIAFVIESVIADDLAAGRLVELFPEHCPPFPGFFIYHASRRQMRPAVRATIDFFPLGEEVDQDAYAGGHGRAPDEQQVKRFAVLRIERFEQRDQPAIGQLVLHRERPDPRDADPGERKLGERFS
ncbi:hypothetical protein LTR94_028122, partial [Friedmanniomyces endolithicus]